MQFRWKFDASLQVLTAPSGRSITVKEIATWLYDQVCHKHDLTGPWAGWKVRRGLLVGPGGVRVSPRQLREMVKNHAAEPPAIEKASSAP